MTGTDFPKNKKAGGFERSCLLFEFREKIKHFIISRREFNFQISRENLQKNNLHTKIIVI